MLLLLAIGACTSSEEEIIGSIYGKVTDSKNGKVLQGVTITLIPGGLSRTTGSDGTYEFLDLEAKQYQVQAQKMGYVTDTKSVNVLVGQAASGDMRLTPEKKGCRDYDNPLFAELWNHAGRNVRHHHQQRKHGNGMDTGIRQQQLAFRQSESRANRQQQNTEHRLLRQSRQAGRIEVRSGEPLCFRQLVPHLYLLLAQRRQKARNERISHYVGLWRYCARANIGNKEHGRGKP